MDKTELYIKSTNGINDLHVIEWKPDIEVKAILQISHGMIEYIDRYDDFARYLATKGILVVGNDHLGHGLSAKDDDELGYFNSNDGSKTVVEDLHKITLEYKKKYNDIPYFLLGHSMGSFLIRRYIMTYPDEADGTIIMGTGSQPGLILNMGKMLLNVIKSFKGDKHRSSLVTNIAFGSYNNQFKPIKTNSDWISRDENVVHKYVNDKHCTFLFTLNGYETLFNTISFIQDEKNIANLNREMPLLFVSGDKDPVGNNGKYVKEIYEKYKKMGINDIDIKLYKDSRHEILNELDREIVYNDIYKWIFSHVKISTENI